MNATRQDIRLGDGEFRRIRDLLHAQAGIALSSSKQALVSGRLQRRLNQLGLDSYSAYLQRIEGAANQQEWQQAVDLLTTNETYFWREPVHFERLQQQAAGEPGREFRVWSAACSSGEEVYSIAMALGALRASGRGPAFRILGSDISQRVLQRAARAHYPLQRAERLPGDLLRRYCLRGTGAQTGTLLIAAELRRQVEFAHINLVEPLPTIGPFDAVFLRNVLIYFDAPTKARVVAAICQRLRPGGRLYVGLAEGLSAQQCGLHAEAPGVYMRRGE